MNPYLKAREPYQRVLDTVVPWIATTEDSAAFSADPERFGFRADEVQRYNPQRLDCQDFFNLVQKLDERVYEPQGMHMPRWVFYDCVAAPGAILGFGQPAAQVDPRIRALLEVPELYDGLVPVSGYYAIPMIEPGAWQCMAIVTADRFCPGVTITGLAQLTIAYALATLAPRRIYGAVQWRDPELRGHAFHAPLEVLSAYTPAHTLPRSLVFRGDIDEHRIISALDEASVPASGERLDCDDEHELRALQARIEAGTKIHILGPPAVHQARTWVPFEEVKR